MLPTVHAHVAGIHLVVSSYAVALALGVGAGLVLALRRASAPEAMLAVVPLVVAGGMLGAALWHRALHGGSGLSSAGGIAGGIAATALAARALRTRALVLLDALAPGALVGLGIGRIGCFLAGCCFGRPTDLPWGVVMPGVDAVARHPVQLYAALANLALAVRVAHGRGPVGAATARALVGYGAVRVALEGCRDPAGSDVLGRVAVATVAGLVAVAVGLAIGVRARGLHDTLPSNR